MKKILFLILLLLCTCSCRSLTRYVYECTVVYSLNDTSFTMKDTLTMDESCVPAYVLSGSELTITGVPTGIYHQERVVYKGSLKIKVEDFQYTLLKIYTVSPITGLPNG